ncbi:hypothetical protein HDV00_003807 [Rhizophlyctis rosea]|nr:hypothetical protein HDV00_003807 [Rhizophlyctis rosea]
MLDIKTNGYAGEMGRVRESASAYASLLDRIAALTDRANADGIPTGSSETLSPAPEIYELGDTDVVKPLEDGSPKKRMTKFLSVARSASLKQLPRPNLHRKAPAANVVVRKMSLAPSAEKMTQSVVPAPKSLTEEDPMPGPQDEESSDIGAGVEPVRIPYASPALGSLQTSDQKPNLIQTWNSTLSDASVQTLAKEESTPVSSTNESNDAEQRLAELEHTYRELFATSLESCSALLERLSKDVKATETEEILKSWERLIWEQYFPSAAGPGREQALCDVLVYNVLPTVLAVARLENDAGRQKYYDLVLVFQKYRESTANSIHNLESSNTANSQRVEELSNENSSLKKEVAGLQVDLQKFKERAAQLEVADTQKNLEIDQLQQAVRALECDVVKTRNELKVAWADREALGATLQNIAREMVG